MSNNSQQAHEEVEIKFQYQQIQSFEEKQSILGFCCINSCNFSSLLCKSIQWQPWPPRQASTAPSPARQTKNQVIQFIKGTNKVNCPKNRVEKVSYNANIIKVGFMKEKSKALVYKSSLQFKNLIGTQRIKVEQSEGRVGERKQNRSKEFQFWRCGTLGERRSAYKWRSALGCPPQC